jgi:hypothetical protein
MPGIVKLRRPLADLANEHQYTNLHQVFLIDPPGNALGNSQGAVLPLVWLEITKHGNSWFVLEHLSNRLS